MPFRTRLNSRLYRGEIVLLAKILKSLTLTTKTTSHVPVSLVDKSPPNPPIPLPQHAYLLSRVL